MRKAGSLLIRTTAVFSLVVAGLLVSAVPASSDPTCAVTAKTGIYACEFTVTTPIVYQFSTFVGVIQIESAVNLTTTDLSAAPYYVGTTLPCSSNFNCPESITSFGNGTYLAYTPIVNGVSPVFTIQALYTGQYAISTPTISWVPNGSVTNNSGPALKATWDPFRFGTNCVHIYSGGVQVSQGCDSSGRGTYTFFFYKPQFNTGYTAVITSSLTSMRFGSGKIDYTSQYSQTFTTPFDVPSPPTNVVVTAGNSQIAVRWAASGIGDGIATPTGYLATAIPTLSTGPSSKTCTTTGISCIINDLQNGVTYSVFVVATSSVGDSQSSSFQQSDSQWRQSWVTPTGPPANATVTSVRDFRTQSVLISGSADNGGLAFTKMIATATPGNKSCTFDATLGGNGTVPACVINGLLTGQTYSFVVMFSNSLGTSPPSVSYNFTPTLQLPPTPSGVIAVPGIKSATISWTPVVFLPGQITFPNGPRYVVTASPGGATCGNVSQSNFNSANLSCSISGLDPNMAYTFTVSVTDSYQDQSPESKPSNSISPTGQPEAPKNVVPVAGDGQVSISWTAPNSHGLSIDRYIVTASPSGLTCQAATTSCTITGLVNGSSYSFTVLAINSAGNGELSVPSNSVIPSVYVPTTTTTVPKKLTPVTTTTLRKITMITISCLKGKLVKKVTAVKPVCPTGYKKK